jgi:hypothetical protein
MYICKLCNKNFKKETGLKKHQEKNSNCINKCSKCLALFSSKQVLTYHMNKVNCVSTFECNKCDKTFDSRYLLQQHTHENIIEPYEKKSLTPPQIIINNNYINSNNEINEINVKKINVKNNFFLTKPNNFRNDFMINEEIRKELSMIDNYDEEIVDKYMYEEKKFKEEQPKDMIYKYEKESLKVQGMRMLFTELQKDPKYQNIQIKKKKSGKCYVYNNEWVENKITTFITKICNKLCDCLYDKDTSVNHFIRLIIADQPRRLSELRKHIEKEIEMINDTQVELIEE